MEIKNAIQQLNEELSLIVSLVDALDEANFVGKKNNDKWSVAEHLVHLSLALLPVNNLFKQPEMMLERWGNSNRKSRDFATFLQDYKNAVANADWKAFPPFVPKSATESADYLQKHSTTSENKKNDFYQLTGESIKGLRDKIQLDGNASKAEIITGFEQQYQIFFQLVSHLSNENLDACQLPLPYVGLITCKEMIYFTYNHTKVHRLAIERNQK